MAKLSKGGGKGKLAVADRRAEYHPHGIIGPEKIHLLEGWLTDARLKITFTDEQVQAIEWVLWRTVEERRFNEARLNALEVAELLEQVRAGADAILAALNYPGICNASPEQEAAYERLRWLADETDLGGRLAAIHELREYAEAALDDMRLEHPPRRGRPANGPQRFFIRELIGIFKAAGGKAVALKGDKEPAPFGRLLLACNAHLPDEARFEEAALLAAVKRI